MKIGNYDLSFRKIIPNTAIHPDYKTLVQFAFEIDGLKYYEFKNLLDMPTERYRKLQTIVTECDWRMSTEEIKEFIKLQKEAINQGKLTDAYEVVQIFEYCINLYMETDLMMKLFSCVFFTIEEDLTDYDFEIAEEKIKAFTKHGVPAFFLNQPIQKYLPLKDISSQDLLVFLKLTNAKKEYLSSIMSKIKKNLNVKD